MSLPRKLHASVFRGIWLSTCAALLAAGAGGGESAALHAPPIATAGCVVPLLGPALFTRSKGNPRYEHLPFVTPDPAAPHFLRIANGGTSGERRPVTSAVVKLNGRTLLRPKHFKKSAHTVERAIHVNALNHMFVRIAGKRDSGFALEILAIDGDPPRVVELAPPDETVVSEDQVTLVFRVEDRLSEIAGASCNGAEATRIDDDFACSVPLAPGPNAIEIAARDACANEGTASVSIVFDPPPAVSISVPDDGQLFFRGPIDVAGTVNEPAADVDVNDVPAVGRPGWAATVPVRKGETTLRAVARDAAGGEGQDEVEVTVLTSDLGPTLRLTTPPEDFLVGSDQSKTSVDVRGRVRVSGVYESANAPRVTVNGLEALVERSDRPGPLCALLGICWWDFDASLFLQRADNPNGIEAVAVDRFGRSDTDSVVGRVDQCFVGYSTGEALEGGAYGQSNRCHAIDGCSTPEAVADDVQDPTAGTLGRRSTAFGKDVYDTEHLPHGVAPGDRLPCNLHDVCYQTCGASKLACDAAMYDDMLAVCREAYPEKVCPYAPDVNACGQWKSERDRCRAWARRYRAGLATPPADQRFIDRQREFCSQ
jgi:hypothetical protein